MNKYIWLLSGIIPWICCAMEITSFRHDKQPTECIVAIKEIEKVHEEIREIIDDYEAAKPVSSARILKEDKEIMSMKYKIAALTAATAIISSGATIAITLAIKLQDCEQ